MDKSFETPSGRKQIASAGGVCSALLPTVMLNPSELARRDWHRYNNVNDSQSPDEFRERLLPSAIPTLESLCQQVQSKKAYVSWSDDLPQEKQ
jgi:hypothetical protein